MSEAKTALEGLRLDRDEAPGDEPRRRRWWWWLVFLLVVGGLGVAFLQRPVAVRTVVARPAEVSGPRILLNASGYVTARREATVSSKVTGKVTEVFIEEGMQVEAGQVLARLDDSNVKASLALSEALLSASQAAHAETRVRVEEAHRELRRVAALVASRVATEADLDRAEAEVKSLEARLAKLAADTTVAEREVGVRRQDLEDTVIRAPFTGIVTVKNAQPGEMISPISAGGGFTRTGICTLVDMASLEIEVDVNESFIVRVTPGQAVEAALDAYPDWKIPCQVVAVIPTADRQKATVKVRIGFEQLDPRILPDMAVKVSFGALENADSAAPAPRPAVLVPRTAVVERDGAAVVFAARNLVVERRAVTVGATQGNDVEIVAGVSAGERVVVDPPAELADGDRIREKQS